MILNVSDISAAEKPDCSLFTSIANVYGMHPNESTDNLALVCVCLVTRGRVVQAGGKSSEGRVNHGASRLGGEPSRGRIDQGRVVQRGGESTRGRIG